MRKTFAGRGVVRVIGCLLSVLAIDAATASLSFAQTPAPDPAAFAAAWQRGTPMTVTGDVTVFYADDFANHRAERVYFVRDQQSGLSFQVRFETAPPVDLQTGSVVRVAGRATNLDLYVAAAQTDSFSTVAPATRTNVSTRPAT